MERLDRLASMAISSKHLHAQNEVLREACKKAWREGYEYGHATGYLEGFTEDMENIRPHYLHTIIDLKPVTDTVDLTGVL